MPFLSSFVTPELLRGGDSYDGVPCYKLICRFVLSQAYFRLVEQIRSINERSNNLQYLERTDVNKKRDHCMGFLKFISLPTNSFEEQNIKVLKGNFKIYF